MAVTYRNIVGKIRGLLKLSSPDALISDRLILSVIQGVNTKLVTQQLNKRIGSNSPNLFTNIPCIRMKSVPLYSCCETQSQCNIAKSIDPIPDIVDSYYNLAIRHVSSVDGKVKFNEMDSPARYSNLLKIYPKTKDKYFFIVDKHLYVTDPEIELVSISAFFRDLVDPQQFSCNKNSLVCPTNPLDLEFRSLPKMEDDIVNICLQELMQTFKNSQEDRSSNGQENT